ncbi:MAG: ABC transporter ATP-binding protein, partial [Nocardioidaceae bacterium]
RLIADTSVADVIASASRNVVRVRTPDAATLVELLRGPDVTVAQQDGALEVGGLTSDQIGVIAAGAGLTLWELSPQQASLEEAFMDLTREAVEYSGATPTRRTAP